MNREAGTVYNHVTGRSWDLNSTHPLIVASLLVQCDLCIMTENSHGEYVLTDACVCFPDRWKLHEKIGQTIAAIHRPVNHFQKIRHAVNMFMHSMKEPSYRFNYTFAPTDKLYLPEKIGGKNEFLRVEKQCFFRLKCGAILFTIRTYHQAIDKMEDFVFQPLLGVLDGK